MSLLPNAFRIQDDFSFVLKRSIPVPEAVTKPKPINDWAMATSSDKPPRMVRLHLTEWAEDMKQDFESYYGDRGCECFISPPCGWCTHEGNPANLDETDDAWVMGFEEVQP